MPDPTPPDTAPGTPYRPPFDLHLMRHGAPVQPGLLLGRTDAAPTAAGVAACLARGRALPVAAVVHSGLRRAAEPARALAAARGCPATPDPRWRELDFGRWDGCPPDAAPADALARFRDDPDACPPPEGERWSALVARVRAALVALPPRPTLVVTHGGAMRAALAALFGFSPAQLWAFDLPYAALLSLRLWPGPDGPGAMITGLRTGEGR